MGTDLEVCDESLLNRFESQVSVVRVAGRRSAAHVGTVLAKAVGKLVRGLQDLV